MVTRLERVRMVLFTRPTLEEETDHCVLSRVIPSKVMVGHGAGCRGLFLEVVAHGDSIQEHRDCTSIKANLEEVGGVILGGLGGPT